MLPELLLFILHFRFNHQVKSPIGQYSNDQHNQIKNNFWVIPDQLHEADGHEKGEESD